MIIADILSIAQQYILAIKKYPYLLISVLIFLAYGASLLNGIVYLDDNNLIINQYEYNHNLKNITQIFSEDIFRNQNKTGYFYRPLLRLSFMADAQFGIEYVVFFSHLSNLILHILAIFLFYLLLQQFKITQNLALIFAIIAGIHPLAANTVAFIPGRNDSLLAIFIFLSFIFFQKYIKVGVINSYILHITFFLLATLTKESAFVFPLILSLYFVLYTPWKQRLVIRKYIALLLGWIIIIALCFLLRNLVLTTPTINADLNIYNSLVQNAPMIINSIGKVVYPIKLSVYPVLKDMTLSYGLLAISTIFAIYIFSNSKNYRLLLFGLGWFMLFIIPAIIKPVYMLPDFLEHRLYLPMFGIFFIFLGINKFPFWDKLTKHNQKFLSNALIIAIIFVLIRITLQRNFHYKNKINFWQNAVATSPNSPSNHGSLGTMYYLEGDYAKAIEEFNQALKLNPKEPTIHNNLGLIYLSQKQYTNALNEFLREKENSPSYDSVYFNLGITYVQLGQNELAIQNFQKTLEINPNHTKALQQLKNIRTN